MIKDKNFNSFKHTPRVLVAPLDWGLGHATRCIPIIFALVEHGCKVIIAASGDTKNLLQKEFPALEFIDIKGYNIQYSRNKAWFMTRLFLQFPKLLVRIIYEKQWLKRAIVDYKINAVISDNRLGLSNGSISSIYITHQLLIKTGNRFTENVAQKIHYYFINKYNSCWVPDWAAVNNLAGNLSHPIKLPAIPVTYLGPLSRFKASTEKIKYDCCFILSGPEPQRSILEDIILKEVQNYNGQTLIVRGLPQQNQLPAINNPLVEIKNHLASVELSKVMQQSKIIISRCGYSTIMDLVSIRKKAVLIPTPGQTEQEYLATYLGEKKFFVIVNQNEFSLTDIFKRVDDFAFTLLNPQNNLLDDTIKSFVTETFNINNSNT
ncbi:MAG TPA: glycosyltransferase [Ferruginibacter sp.]|nr:glycosyltransferase [Ferruginibacter sp.]